MSKTLIIGLGNPIMGDDAVGCKCIDMIKAEGLAAEGVEVDSFFRGGISLMERIIGYDRVLIIDSFSGSGKSPGTISHLKMDDLPSRTAASPHDGSLKAAYEFGQQMGVPLPVQVDIIAVEIEPKYEFSEELSPPVKASLRQVFELVLDWLEDNTAGLEK